MNAALVVHHSTIPIRGCPNKERSKSGDACSDDNHVVLSHEPVRQVGRVPSEVRRGQIPKLDSLHDSSSGGAITRTLLVM